MRRSLLAFSLFAALPCLAQAQDPKLVNCRSLEAAGNFVGPDEVIIDDMVCQKAKPGANPSKTQAQPPKPIIGATISDTPADNVVEAAKAAEQRIAARKEKEAAENQKSAAEPPPVGVVTSPAPAAPAPVPPAIAAKPSPDSVSQPHNPPSEVAAPAPAAATVSRQSEPASTAEIVIESPSSAPAATSSATAREPNSPAEVAAASVPASQPAPPAAQPVPAPSTAEAAPPPRPEEALPPADPTHPATSSGFYDANAPKRSSNASAQMNSGFASAEQVNAGLVPGATSIPPASPPSSEAAAPAPEPEPKHTTIAASRVAFDDPERDRSVKVGEFARPTEVSPDPASEHRTSVDASDADGFQDRQRPECTKNVTLAGLKGERLVLGVPAWAAKWIEKNEKHMPEICFSETPMKTARNYLIVFSTPAGSTGSKDVADAVLNPAKDTTATGVGTFTTSFGSTWHYSYDRNVGTTVLTQDDADEPHGRPGQVLYATAYTEEGVPVSQRWPAQLKRELKSGEKNSKKVKGENEALENLSSGLLAQMVQDIQKF